MFIMKKWFLFSVFFFVLFSVSAQQYQEEYLDEYTGRKRIFFGLGIKGNAYINDNAISDFGVWTRPSVGLNFFAGSWFSRVIGGRIVLEGGKLHPYFQQRTIRVDEKYFLGRLDFLFDVTNLYGADRVYNLIPYAGVSGARAFGAVNRPDGAKSSNSFFFGVGLLNTFRLSRNTSFFINLGFDFVDANFDGSKSKNELNGIASGGVGVIF